MAERKRCEYTWERKVPGRRYVSARGHCKRNATGDCDRCSEHCLIWLGPFEPCDHATRRRTRRTPLQHLPGEYMGTPYGDGY